MFAKKDTEKEKRQREGVARVRGFLEELLPAAEKDEDSGGSAPAGKETSVIVNQLACMEEGCPDVEVVMTLLRAKPRPKLMFKVFKAAADMTLDDVKAAMGTALADEAKAANGGHAEHGHAEHGHADGHGDGHHDCDGCGHDHHENEHAQKSEHGH